MLQEKKRAIFPKRGEIYLVNFDPTIGSEIQKIRPALILQNDIANRYSPITIVAAITSHINEKFYPTEIFLPKQVSRLSQDSVILLNQIRTVDKIRLIRRLGVISKDLLGEVERALLISLGLVDI